LPKAQSYESHRRYFPAHHFIVQPILIAWFFYQLGRFLDARSVETGMTALLGLGLVVFAFSSRVMSLTAQNRVIRLEERLRLMRLMPPEDHARIDELKTRQLVGLRFASDSEVVDLARRCLSGELDSSSAVKKEVKEWRPDYLRV
jgi:hypothetical protein